MATVSYSTSANFGAKTAIAIGNLRSALADLTRVRDAASALANNTSWDLLEGGDFGVSSGQGQAFFDAINGMCLALNTQQALAGFNNLDKGA